MRPRAGARSFRFAFCEREILFQITARAKSAVYNVYKRFCLLCISVTPILVEQSRRQACLTFFPTEIRTFSRYEVSA